MKLNTFKRTFIVFLTLISLTLAGYSSTTYAAIDCASGTNSIWPADPIPATTDSDTVSVEIGVQFRSNVDGFICGIRFYKSTANLSTHVGTLWSGTGQVLANVTFNNETESGWQRMDFATPVPITANTVYTASYLAPVGSYSVDQNYFTTAGVTSGSLHALSNIESNGNGVYLYGPGGLPTNSYNSSNYWVDVVFTETSVTDLTPPTITSVTPVDGATGISLGTSVTATFVEAMDPASINISTFELTDPDGVLVTASVSYSGLTASLTPTNGPLTPNTVYTATVTGGTSGVKDLAGNVLVSAMTWQFTTDAGDITPPTVVSVTPVDGAIGISLGTSVTATFVEAMDPASINTSTFELRDADGVLVTASVSYAGLTATLTPTSGPLTPNTVYTATVVGGASGVVDLAGNALESNLNWQFTIDEGGSTSCASGATTIWSPSDIPAVSSANDSGAVELGVKFKSDVDGYICGIRFYKGTANSGTHVGNLWSVDGQLLATATFTNETSFGWQQVDFSNPVQITANATYLASYHAPVGGYSTDQGYFSGAQLDNPPLRAQEDNASGGNGVYIYGPGGFPSNSYLSTNYWVDVVFSETNEADTTPPTVLSVTPLTGATAVSLGTTATVTFSEAMETTSINATTFELRDPGNTLVAGTISYTQNTATLTTTAPLLANTTYTATVIGSAGGVKDLTGNPLLADFDWSFTTADSTPDSTPPVVALTAPTDGTTVVGNIAISATATDNTGIQSVQFILDGTNIGVADSTLPYSVNWDTSTSANGTHVLEAFARDLNGNEALSSSVTVNVNNSTGAAQFGQWSSPIDLPTVAVNLILLHTGKVLFWAGDSATAPNFGELWDPLTNEITPVPNPFSNIFCSSHITLPDGRLLVAGGFDKEGGFLGISESNTFDPVTESWTSLPSMSFRRWYPTMTSLGDGRAIITSGSEDSESVFVEISEIYDPVANTWTQLSDAPMSIPQYPMMYLLPDGKLLQSGTTEHTTNTKVLDIETQQWTVIDSEILEGGSGVMYSPGRIMKAGSSSNDGATPSALSSATTYVLDMNDSSPAWRETSSMAFSRTFLNLTSLPDGSVLATSGSQRKSEINLEPAVLEAEVWSPETETWTTMAPMLTPRIYHSTAVLLPDGRVAVSGSGNIPGGTDQLNMEVYSPPYLFKGPRPVITSAPNTLQYGSTFAVQTPDAADISAVNLVRLGAATHNFDQDQRFVPLSFVQNGNTLDVQTLTNKNVVPPGYYMLFIINSNGVPSVAEFVRFPAGYEDSVPPPAPENLTVTGTLSNASLTWDAVIDNTGITEYEIHRSTIAGFVPSSATLIARPTSTNYNDAGLPAGTFYYRVIAVDTAGNISGPSNEASITIAGSSGPQLTVTLPQNNASIIGSTVDVNYTVTGDLSNVSHVHFKLDGGPDLMDPPPIDGIFQLTNITPGPHTIDGYVVSSDHTKFDGSDASSVNFTVLAPDIEPPVVVIVSPLDGNTIEGIVTLTALATDNASVQSVQFVLDDTLLGTEDTVTPFSLSWDTTTVPNGAYYLTAIAKDSSNNTTESISIGLIVSNTQLTIPGLVASYNFESGAGLNVQDGSGNNNNGTISGATWDPNGRYGGALSFDGNNDWVTIPDADSLDLTDGMTLEAWVNPTELSGWRTLIQKDIPNGLSYALYAHDNAPRPAGYISVGGSSTNVQGNSALPLNSWTHLALTFDGAIMRLYENGVEVGNRVVSNSIDTSTGQMSIGGNSIWGEYFSGRIDEVRIYNRALDLAEIQISMNNQAISSQPTRSSPIVVDSTGRRIWLVNPDNNSVAAINADSLQMELELPVGIHPMSIALDDFGQIWVVCQNDDSVWVLDATSGTVLNVLTLPWGSAPVSIVFSPDGVNGYIANHGSGQIQKVDAASQSLASTLSIGTTPRALAITADGQRMLVTQFISTNNQGTVRSVNLANFAEGVTLSLPIDATTQDGSLAGRGLPNYLSGIAINPGNGQSWLVAKKDNILRGLFRDGQSLTFETTVRAQISTLDLLLNEERIDRRIDIDNHGQPSSVTLSRSGELIFVTMQGNNRLLVLNQLGNEIMRVGTGLAPQGVAIDPITNRVFTKDFMSRTATVFDGASLLNEGIAALPQLAQIQTVSTEQMSSDVLLGKQVFYNAADPRMSRDSYISCAVCHLDGEHDGQVWDFTDRNEGLRNTITLKGQGGNAGVPLHWTGNFDEVQDFENDIRNFFGGTGFMVDADFFVGTRSEPLGDPKEGLSPTLDALSAYVDSLTDTVLSPHRQTDGTMTAGAQAGQTLFEVLNCSSCHSGDRFSDSNTGLRHDVGTIKPSSGLRIGDLLDGFDTPMLPGLWATAPYLHDGSAATLLDVLTTSNPGGLHADVTSLTSEELGQLIEYLKQLEFNAP